MDHRRIADGWFTYIFLELNKRWGYEVVLDGSEKEIENAIVANENVYKTHFRKYWSSHQCDAKGCGKWIIVDGGMKPHRMVCAAKYSAIRTYKHTDVKTVVGCGNKPGIKSEFCSEHQKENAGPVVMAEKLSVETRSKLRKGQPPNLPQDTVFFVQSLLKQDKDKVLVKWANLPTEDATWELESAVPGFIGN